MAATQRPNIVFLVWDACRKDYAEEYAVNLRDLGESGIWFENAIAPSNWTRPSHASMFTGTYPHEHRVTQAGFRQMPTELVSELNDNRYSTHCVSGNDHLSHRTGFIRPFDSYFYTRLPQSSDGLNALRYVHENELLDGSSTAILWQLMVASFNHDSPLRSLTNVLRLAFYRRAPDVPFEAIRWRKYYRDRPRPERETRIIRRIIDTNAERNDPFFIFNNSVSTHDPYVPNRRLQRKHLGTTLSTSEIKRLTENLGNNWAFEKRVTDDEIDEEDLATVRDLYAASIEQSDIGLGNVIDELKARGVFDNTLLIITADHGEDLGEVDSVGRRRFGHGNSISDNVCRVPLVVFHPDLTSETVDDVFSLKDLFFVIRNASRPDTRLETRDITDLCRDHVLCEFPAAGGIQSMRNNRPEIRDEYIQRRCTTNVVAGYDADGRVVLDSDGNATALRRGKHVDVNDVPDSLMELVTRSLAELDEISTQSYEEGTISLLEDMGYI